MTSGEPPFPEGRPRRFRATVHGTVFGDRTRHLEGLAAGEALLLIPDPPGQEDPDVWVHLTTGDPIGHLPPEIGHWLAPWLRQGGGASVRMLKLGDADVPSWRRVLVEVDCRE